MRAKEFFQAEDYEQCYEKYRQGKISRSSKLPGQPPIGVPEGPAFFH